jgi:hypothetical protein
VPGASASGDAMSGHGRHIQEDAEKAEAEPAQRGT